MHRKFRITVDGRAYDVVVEEIGGETSALPPAGAHPAASAVAAPAPAAAAAHARSKPEAGAGDEVAPLAGTVESINVTVGQSVAVGDKIATIEAMKMKTEVFAKGAGKVMRSQSSPAIRSTPAASCSRSPEGADPMTIPDTVYGALLLSVIDFFLSMVMISGIGVVLGLFPLLNRLGKVDEAALRQSDH